jgi:eukaryotic-like serine/threonine-protein kinase
MFATVATGSAAEHSSGPLPASLAVIGVLSVLRKPLALSLGDTAWVQHQLPSEERALLLEHRIELLVPISSELSGDLPLALLVLGPRRSEEPYNQEDLDLLVTIAQAVALLLERSSGDRHTLTECDSCGRCFDAGAEVCTHDHQPLTTARGSRLLNGRYRLERRLGRGGMGAVYSAVDDVLERPVAVKLIREDVVGPLDLASRFRREARAAAGFAHPHVVRVYDYGVDRDRRPFLIMELLEGDTLRQRLASGVPLSTPDALHILRGVCSALSAAHGQGLVHRDLKPENIFLQRHANGVVPKVLDFGLAKAFDAQWSPTRSTVTSSSAGLLVGTLEYMAPEQVAGDDVNPGWDIWAVGVIAYEMLTGSHPFRRTVAFASDDTVADLTVAGQGPKHLSDAVAGFFRTALSPERALRPREALEFLAACEQVLV